MQAVLALKTCVQRSPKELPLPRRQVPWAQRRGRPPPTARQMATTAKAGMPPAPVLTNSPIADAPLYSS